MATLDKTGVKLIQQRPETTPQLAGTLQILKAVKDIRKKPQTCPEETLPKLSLSCTGKNRE